ncbi:MAG: hypothetical protein ACO1TE_00545 [Prosthecobacter sp.]
MRFLINAAACLCVASLVVGLAPAQTPAFGLGDKRFDIIDPPNEKVLLALRFPEGQFKLSACAVDGDAYMNLSGMWLYEASPQHIVAWLAKLSAEPDACKKVPANDEIFLEARDRYSRRIKRPQRLGPQAQVLQIKVPELPSWHAWVVHDPEGGGGAGTIELLILQSLKKNTVIWQPSTK